MNPTTLKLALRGAKQGRTMLNNRKEFKRRQEFDALQQLRDNLATEGEREGIIAGSPAHVKAVAELMLKEEGAAAALEQARAAAAARKHHRVHHSDELTAADVADMSSTGSRNTADSADKGEKARDKAADKADKARAKAEKKAEAAKKKAAKAQAKAAKKLSLIHISEPTRPY